MKITIEVIDKNARVPSLRLTIDGISVMCWARSPSWYILSNVLGLITTVAAQAKEETKAPTGEVG